MKGDSKLLTAVRRGDEAATRKLVNSYSPRLYNLALRKKRRGAAQKNPSKCRSLKTPAAAS
jgi:hypothetical protein